MSALDVALFAGGLILSLALIVAAILLRWLIPGWAYADKVRECDDLMQKCDNATKLASQATTIAEQLVRSSLAVSTEKSVT